MNPMTMETPVIDIRDLVRRYGRTDAVNGLSLRVEPGRCYGFFGRNGAGKTTTIKCLLNLLRPTSGETKVFGLDPARHEVAVKSRLAYVPDSVAFYPWMTVRDTLDYFAVVPRALEPRHRARAAVAIPPRRAAEDEPPVERAAHPARADHRGLSGARAAGARRADLRARSDRPAGVHPDDHRRLPGRRARPADGLRLHASHLRVRGVDRRVHDHRAGQSRPHARCRRGPGALPEDLRALRLGARRRWISPARASFAAARATSRSSSTATPPTCSID